MSDVRTVLVVGSTGSIGRLVVEASIERGFVTRALVRDAGRARGLSSDAQIVVGDLTDATTLADAVDGVDAVVFTQGTHGSGAEAVDYGAVRNVLDALGDRPARIALMTTIGVTVHADPNDEHAWKRRGERLVRASGREYTIVRPGWFDDNSADEMLPVFLQGDTRRAGDPSDGGIARVQIAQVLVASLTSDEANRTTLELVATAGSAPADPDLPFADLDVDVTGQVDGVRDPDTLPLAAEPQRFLDDLARIGARA